MGTFKAMCITMMQALFTRAKRWEPAKLHQRTNRFYLRLGMVQQQNACLAQASPWVQALLPG